MKEVTVIELSEQTGLTRSKIYYLIKKGKILISNGKINYKEALQVITTFKINKTKVTDDENFRHILNMLYLQNITLQEQLDLAYKREKNYLAELANYRQSLVLKPTLTPFIDENNSQEEQGHDLANTDKNSLTRMQSESKNHTPAESCQSINKEIQPPNEITTHTSPIGLLQNEMILSETNNRPKNAVIEQKKDNTVLESPLSSSKDTKQPKIQNKHKKTVAMKPAQIPKSISVTVKPKLNQNKQSEQTYRNESIADQKCSQHSEC